ncbi:MAG: GNAT family N-acetyltransferase [Coleofasciculaceae cyanobacterium]
MSYKLPPGYQLCIGSGRQRSTLLKFLKLSYQELFPEHNDFSHLKETISKYFSPQTPLWWVETVGKDSASNLTEPVACLWLGNAVDQVRGDRYSHIFLLHVLPEHRRQGIGSALMRQAEDWARERGDRQIGLQVFQGNQPALTLYKRLGYASQSFSMIKRLN